MNCPSCRSQNVQRVEMAWATQTRTGAFVGADTNGDVFGGTTSSSTPLAERIAPPEAPGHVLTAAGFGGAVVLLLLGLRLESLLILILAVAAGIVGGYGLVQQRAAHGTWELARARWRMQWICLACGATFTPDAGVVSSTVIDAKPVASIPSARRRALPSGPITRDDMRRLFGGTQPK